MFRKIKDWYRPSNRYKHARLGAYIFFFMLFANLLVLSVGLFPSLFNAVLTTFLVMVAVEAKDKQQGGRPDVNDILAGMTAPFVTCFLVLLGCLICLFI